MMPRTIPLARYLFTRLSQQNVHAVHGVPGDFTLKALDHLQASNLRWIGNCNELNAGYAADGYARVRGLGALYTTYGVGELSALNAVAGSYAEHVPVVHIVGTAARRIQAMQRRYLCVHHTLGDGRLGVFRQVAEQFSCARVDLKEPERAAESIDWVIGEAMRCSRPVYVELPSDMVAVEVGADRLDDSLAIQGDGKTSGLWKHQAKALLQRLYGAKQPLLLVESRGWCIPDEGPDQ